ncbi:hypothetical protein L0B53_14990 [Vibrio sp. SS-MA-C1-2]|uniref:hypothetical protein n=1 Tax=Vibrio sp. SS-MA-C1-2 TaxID=2908646 RepID=UPI001F26D32F|nr:hypothetical protein [Vibrio sp. SS-MA-C1-2]UJF18313.1 hypothetical protein L0B53_14990 [Vibrio sp. SS-MA-C1-2]
MTLISNFNIEYENNRYMKKFLHQYAGYRELIFSDISIRLEQLILSNSPKIKMVHRMKHHNLSIYEYKIPLAKNLDCRVAYTFTNNIISVFFISTTIIKAHFCRLLEKTDLISGTHR